jgi:2-phospho-L-lactate guanylyltransferase
VEAILIPVKSLDAAKRRLAESLAPEDRRRLGLAMLADVLRASEKWSARWIVTSDPDAEAVGLAFGCALVRDPGGGLNEAIRAGAAQAIAAGADPLLILQSDVPLVSSHEISSIFGAEAQMVIVPSGDGGTSALLTRPPLAISPAFGPGSAERHRRAAEAAGLESRRMDLASLVLDVDTPEDLRSLAAASSERESVRLARELLGGG